MSAIAVTISVLGACTTVGPGGSPTAPSTSTEVPSITPPSASPAAASPSLSAPAALPGARWTWAETGTQHLAGTAGGPGWVIVGSATPVADPTSQFSLPTAWTSIDGRTWTRSQVAIPVGATNGEITVVTRGPDGLVAAGTVDLTKGTVWQSVDGRTWEVIGTGSLFDLGPCYEGCARMLSIAAGPGAIVVSGYRVTAMPGADVWVSRDGSAWRLVRLPAPSGTGVRVASESWVTATAAGFLAVGSVCGSEGTGCRAVTWTSADGIYWRGPTDLPDGANAGALRAVLGGNRMVILGQRCVDGCRYTAWSSTDGAAWTVGHLLAGDVASQERGLLTFAGDRFLTIGSRGQAIEVWSSTDGLAWQQEAVEAGSFVPATGLLIIDLAGRTDAALAVGFAGSDEMPGVWTSP